ncbi:MAG: GNAT family N-acetyltransferase [Nocardiopsaceae bacterium]|nr:GNAT family N-acetyltransferase [Nocardiopsaceae bacterium]
MLSPFTLEGHGVRLEPLADAHAADLAEAAAGDRSAHTWVPDGPEDARRYVRAALSGARDGRAVPFAIRDVRDIRHHGDGRVVGSTRFLDLDVFAWPPPWPPGVGRGPEPSDDQPPTVAEIGSTWLAAGTRRTGVNPACKLLLLAHAFEAWGVARVTLKTDARNKTSRAAIDRLGAQFEGVRRAHGPASDGTIRDTAYFSILAAEWPAVRDHLEYRLSRPR